MVEFISSEYSVFHIDSTVVGQSTGNRDFTVIGSSKRTAVIDAAICLQCRTIEGDFTVECAGTLSIATEQQFGISQRNCVICTHGEVTEVIETSEVEYRIICSNDFCIVIHQDLTGLRIAADACGNFRIIQYQFSSRVTIFIIAAVQQDIAEFNSCIFHAESTGIVTEIVVCFHLNCGILTFACSCITDNVNTIFCRIVITTHQSIDFHAAVDRGLTAAVEGCCNRNCTVDDVFTCDIDVFGFQSNIVTQSQTVHVHIVGVFTVADLDTVGIFGCDIAGESFAGNCITYIAFDNEFFGIGSFGCNSIRQAAKCVDTIEFAIAEVIAEFTGECGINIHHTHIDCGKCDIAISAVNNIDAFALNGNFTFQAGIAGKINNLLVTGESGCIDDELTTFSNGQCSRCDCACCIHDQCTCSINCDVHGESLVIDQGCVVSQSDIGTTGNLNRNRSIRAAAAEVNVGIVEVNFRIVKVHPTGVDKDNCIVEFCNCALIDLDVTGFDLCICTGFRSTAPAADEYFIGSTGTGFACTINRERTVHDTQSFAAGNEFTGCADHCFCVIQQELISTDCTIDLQVISLGSINCNVIVPDAGFDFFLRSIQQEPRIGIVCNVGTFHDNHFASCCFSHCSCSIDVCENIFADFVHNIVKHNKITVVACNIAAHKDITASVSSITKDRSKIFTIDSVC